jgi:acyl-coenzyme A synthetase/AMP-(fatty) acid ligase
MNYRPYNERPTIKERAMKKFDRIKKFVVDHQEGIVMTGVVAGAVALYAVALKLAINQYNDELAFEQARQNKLMDAVTRGDTILPNSDGSFWILPKAS